MTQNTRSLTTEQRKFQTDRFTLHLEKPGRWKVSGRDIDGRYRRIRFRATDLSEAMRKAELILQEPTVLLEPHSPSNSYQALHIADVLLQSSQNRDWTAYTRKRDGEYSEYFLDWVDKQGLQYWHELTFDHILAYKKSLLDRQLSFNTIRLYLLPVRRAARWISANWPKDYINICQELRLSKRDSFNPSYQEDQGNPFLPVHQVLDFLDWLIRPQENNRRTNKWQLAVGVSLQGLAGLQLQEALRLRGGKFDSRENTIIIDGFVKNEYRVRKIPVVDVVSGILRRGMPSSGDMTFITAYASHDEYAKAIRRELRAWDSHVKIAPKDLRNTVITEAIDGGWYGYYVQRYVGHAPQTIGERHYHGNQEARMIPLFREKVVARLEDLIRTWNAPVDSLVLPGPRLVVNQ